MTKDKEIKRLVAILGNLSDGPKIYATISEGPKFISPYLKDKITKISRYQKTN